MTDTPELKALYDSAVARKLTFEQSEKVLNAISRGGKKGRLNAGERSAAFKDLQVVELENLPKGRALTEADSKVLSDWLNGVDENGVAGAAYGGRWGTKEVRELNHAWASKYENEGWTVTGGAGRPSVKNPKGSEERFVGPAADDVTYVDITLTKGSETMRIQTVTTKADGVTLIPEEADAVARIRAMYPNDKLITVSKQTGKIIKQYP